ncbi:MAG: hypothetical protein H0U49_07995 [Parachlamydiaceae bacterium]|nr:hypothetical protein [Parachlamydiaceae bacterium]
MDFTREPIIETVITPKEGCTLAVRSSKGTGQEEYFVDAVEVVSFGNALFFRSLERPKNFMLPVSDYEILEVRETRLVLKNVGLDRSIKIAGGREASLRTANRGPQERTEATVQPPVEVASQPAPLKTVQVEGAEVKPEAKLDKKRDRRRNYKRKKGRDDLQDGDKAEEGETPTEKGDQPQDARVEATKDASGGLALPAVFSSLLPPPSTLISETIARYKDNALFRGAFFVKEGEAAPAQEEHNHPPTDNLEIDHPQLDTPQDDDLVELPSISLDLPTYIPPEMSEEEVERIYQERRGLRLKQIGRNTEGEDADSLESENVDLETKLSVDESQRRFAEEFEDDLEIPNEQAIKQNSHQIDENDNATQSEEVDILDENSDEVVPEGVNPEEFDSDLHNRPNNLQHKKSTGSHSIEDYSSDHRDSP